MGKTPWYQSLLTPQMGIALFGAMVAVVIFWTRTEDSWNKVKTLNTQIETKADETELKAVDDKINRQFQTIRELSERVVALEKLVEYQRGYQKAVEESIKKP